MTDDNRVSLHDCVISSKIFEKDIIIHFDTGFDVYDNNRNNDTGRHKSTSASAIILKDGEFKSFITSGCTITDDKNTRELEPTILSFEDFKNSDLEVLSYEIEMKNNIVEIEVLIHNTISNVSDISDFAVVTLSGSELIFCWDKFVKDAWFQDWGINK